MVRFPLFPVSGEEVPEPDDVHSLDFDGSVNGFFIGSCLRSFLRFWAAGEFRKGTIALLCSDAQTMTASSPISTPSRQLHTVDELDFPDEVTHFRAVDWGASIEHPFVCLWGYVDGQGDWKIYDE